MQDVNKIREKFNTLKGEKSRIDKSIFNYEREITRLTQLKIDLEDSLTFVQDAAQITQSQIIADVTTVVSLALSSVFEDPYTFKMEFPVRRNRTEADLYFEKGGNRLDDLEDMSSGGALDIAAFGLRCACLKLDNNPKRQVLILDEPLKHLRGEDNKRRASDMITRVSHELGIQMVVICDINFTVDADRVFNVRKVAEDECVVEIEE